MSSRNTPPFESALRAVRRAFGNARPVLGIILGSGWSQAADEFRGRAALRYANLPGLGAPEVTGHDGELVWAEQHGRELFLFRGRRHWYEGCGFEPVVLPVRLLKACGAQSVLLTNSAGAIRRDLRPGDLMVIEDHINAMGVNPLVGPQRPDMDQRFPDMSAVYDPALRSLLHQMAGRSGLRLKGGVYAAVSGPAYETPAEIAAFRKLGADAIGMSTVPEAMVGHALGLRVAAVSCITNAAGAGRRLLHNHVLAVAAAAVPRMRTLLRSFVGALGEQEAC